MRLVDLLLTPRQTTSLHPFGGQARDGPIWMTQAAPAPRRSPIHGTNQQMTDNLPMKTNSRNYNQHESPVTPHAIQNSSSRSVGALSDLLRSARSPSASGYSNHSGVTPSSQSVTTELSRLLLQQDSIHPETQAPDNDDTQRPQGARTPERSGTQIRTELVTLDKNLNCTIWKNEGVFRVNSTSSSSSSSASLSSSSSCSSSKSSICEPIRVPMGRRVSLLSSDGSDLDPRDHILSTMADSDSHESLSSPLEEMKASRWMDQAASAGYGDWQNLEDGGEDREDYDVFDSYPLFNFNILGNTLECSDSPFTPLDGNYLFASDENIAFGSDSLVAMEPGFTATSMTTDPGSKVDAGMKQLPSGCHDYKPYGVNSVTENMFQAQLSLSNAAVRHQNNSSDESLFIAPSFSSSILSGGASDNNEPRSTSSPPQSEVVKLLLQNRRQWAPPAEKQLPPHGGYRGSRKRTQGSSAKETSRAKAPRSSRLVPLPSERRHSAPSLTRKATPFVSTASLKLEEDQSVSLERLITELILLESENAYSGIPSDTGEDLKCSTWTTVRQERDVKRPNSIADELFEGLNVVCPTSDVDLFSSLELESIYSGDCAELLSLQDAQQFHEGIEGFNVVIKPDPDPAESPSPAHSIWNQECFDFPENRYSKKTTTTSFSARCNQTQNGISGNADAEAAALEGVLQSKLFLDSPPVSSESPTASECTTKTDQAIIDHDYCQTDALSSTDAPNVEPAWLSRHRKYSKCCLNRGANDYSALKSLLLDSNLTEEVRKEAELDRAKSRKNMAEKPTLPVIAEPLRATLRCRGKGVCGDDEDDALLTAEGESPLRLLYKNLTALTGGQISLKSLFEQLLSSEETSNPGVVERIADSVDRLSTGSGPADPCQKHPQVVEKREEPEDVASFELGAPLASNHLDLCSGGDIENAVFFNSFEEFYSSSSAQDLESTTELQVEERSEGSSSSSESSHLPTDVVFKKPRSRHHSLKKGTSRIVGRRIAARMRAMRSGQLVRKPSAQTVTPPQGCRGVRIVRKKPVFVDQRSEKRQMSTSARLKTVE